MTSLGRLFVGTLLIMLNVSCRDASDPCPDGCWGGGSPHPYTSYSGGTTENIYGRVSLAYTQGVLVETCASEVCAWSGGLISIRRALPKEWTSGDAGEPDAGIDDAGDDDAGDADAFIGVPRGWGRLGRVAVIDLGSTDLTASSRLVGARIIYCSDPYETLASFSGDAGAETSSSTFTCLSGGVRPANIEPLYGTLSVRSSRNGNTTSDVRVLDAKNDSGFVADVTHSKETAPYTSSSSPNCY